MPLKTSTLPHSIRSRAWSRSAEYGKNSCNMVLLNLMYSADFVFIFVHFGAAPTITDFKAPPFVWIFQSILPSLRSVSLFLLKRASPEDESLGEASSA